MSDEVRAAIERAKQASLNAAIGCREMAFVGALAKEDAVMRMMALSRFESIGVHTKWNWLNESEQAREIGTMRAALRALAKEIEK